MHKLKSSIMTLVFVVLTLLILMPIIEKVIFGVVVLMTAYSISIPIYCVANYFYFLKHSTKLPKRMLGNFVLHSLKNSQILKLNILLSIGFIVSVLFDKIFRFLKGGILAFGISVAVIYLLYEGMRKMYFIKEEKDLLSFSEVIRLYSN